MFVRKSAYDAAQAREMGYCTRLVQLEAELAAERRRADEATGRETYWRIRAEKFLDQIALRSGNIDTPTMSEVPPPPRSAAETALGALGRTEINRDRVGPSRMQVGAVDGAVALQMVESALQTKTS